MNTQETYPLIKVRSYRRVLSDAMGMFYHQTWALLRALWPWLLLSTLVTTATVLLTIYDRYFWIPLAITAVLAEFFCWLKAAQWLTRRPLRQLPRSAGRHALLLACVVVGGAVMLLPVCAIVALPAIVLALAEWNAQYSIALGDAPSMPVYVTYLTVVTCLLTALLHVWLRLLIVYIGYFAWGSAEAAKRERQQQLNINA